jgi:hypothetical protein
MKLAMASITALMLTACQTKSPPAEGGVSGSAPDLPLWASYSPAEIVLLGATALAAAGGLCLVGAFVAFIFLGNRKLGITLLTCAAGCIVGAPILYWVGANLWWIALLAALVGLGAGFLLVRKHIDKIETFLGVDLDRDGDIGIHGTKEAKK